MRKPEFMHWKSPIYQWYIKQQLCLFLDIIILYSNYCISINTYLLSTSYRVFKLPCHISYLFFLFFHEYKKIFIYFISLLQEPLLLRSLSCPQHTSVPIIQCTLAFLFRQGQISHGYIKKKQNKTEHIKLQQYYAPYHVLTLGKPAQCDKLFSISQPVPHFVMRVPVFSILYHLYICPSTLLSLQGQISCLEHVIVTIVSQSQKQKGSLLVFPLLLFG